MLEEKEAAKQKRQGLVGQCQRVPGRSLKASTAERLTSKKLKKNFMIKKKFHDGVLRSCEVGISIMSCSSDCMITNTALWGKIYRTQILCEDLLLFLYFLGVAERVFSRLFLVCKRDQQYCICAVQEDANVTTFLSRQLSSLSPMASRFTHTVLQLTPFSLAWAEAWLGRSFFCLANFLHLFLSAAATNVRKKLAATDPVRQGPAHIPRNGTQINLFDW